MDNIIQDLENELFERAKTLFNYHKSKMEFYANILGKNNNYSPDLILPSEVIVRQQATSEFRSSNKRSLSRGSFADAVINCLEMSGRPQLTGDLMKMVKDFGRKVSSSSNFGSQLNATLKSNPQIKKDKIDNKVAVWGLASWFDGDHLKAEYVAEMLPKIRKVA